MTLRQRIAAAWAWVEDTFLKECPPEWEHAWEHTPPVAKDSRGIYRTPEGVPLYEVWYTAAYRRTCTRCGAHEVYMQCGADPGDGHPIIGWSRVPSPR